MFFLIHAAFDFLAAVASLSLTIVIYRWRLSDEPAKLHVTRTGYAIALVGGAVFGGFSTGTFNLWLTDIPGIGRSIVGALFGAILFIEIYKRSRGITGSTGLIFVPAFTVSVIVGRWGCFLSGLEDHTYGTETSLLWAFDFGDGLGRHPVQLYESFAMVLFLGMALISFARRSSFFMSNGFYLLVVYYGSQRFLWEFLKPYAVVAGPFNLFHLVCVALVLYGISMMILTGRKHD